MRFCEQGRAMDRLAEDRKGPSSMEHKKRQMVAALDTNVKVLFPAALPVLIEGAWNKDPCTALQRVNTGAMHDDKS